jgi:Cu/Ag efflux pump CusA
METSPTSRLPAAAVSGAWALTVLPIDAGPDVTNVQVNVLAKHLS